MILRAYARALPLKDEYDAIRLGFLIQRSVTLLWVNVPKDGRPYVGAFSGGKDSIVIKELARMAGVPVEWHYHQTTIDPPELVRFIRQEHPDVVWDKPKHGNLFIRAEKKGFPTWRSRWCCDEYKESSVGASRTEITGIRIAEGERRKRTWTQCVMSHSKKPKTLIVMPIRLWSDEQVWEFIKYRGINYCSLYDEGFKRLGCIGCPLITPKQRQFEFDRWPGFERRWKLLFRRLWAARSGKPDRNGNEWWGSRHCDSWEELWDWWNGGQKNISQWRLDRGLRLKIAPKKRCTTTPAMAGLMEAGP